MSWIQHFLRRPPPPSLLQQWQAEARLARLQVLPLHLLLQTQLRSLEASEEAARAKTASSRDRPKLWRRIARMTGFARSAPAPAPARRILPPCLQRLVVLLRRRFLLWVLIQGLRVVRLALWCRGIKAR